MGKTLDYIPESFFILKSNFLLKYIISLFTILLLNDIFITSNETDGD